MVEVNTSVVDVAPASTRVYQYPLIFIFRRKLLHHTKYPSVVEVNTSVIDVAPASTRVYQCTLNFIFRRKLLHSKNAQAWPERYKYKARDARVYILVPRVFRNAVIVDDQPRLARR
jgi:hypothetical protein